MKSWSFWTSRAKPLTVQNVDLSDCQGLQINRYRIYLNRPILFLLDWLPFTEILLLSTSLQVKLSLYPSSTHAYQEAPKSLLEEESSIINIKENIVRKKGVAQGQPEESCPLYIKFSSSNFFWQMRKSDLKVGCR